MNLLITTQRVDKEDSNLGFFHDWIEEFSKHCNKVTVVCLHKGKYDLPENVKVLSLGKEKIKPYNSRLTHIFYRFLFVLQFYKYIWQERKKYDAVFVHMLPEYVVLGGAFWKILGKQIGLWFMHKSVMPTLKIAEKFVDVIFTGTKDSCRIKSRKIKIVGHGIDTRKFFRHTQTDNKFKILSIGRVTPRKDIMTLLKAVDLLNRENKMLKTEVEIVGGAIYKSDEIYLEELKAYTKENGLEKKVKFLGPISSEKRYEVFGTADLLAHTSNTGSLDKVVLEAMASECLVVSCNDSSKEVLEPFGSNFIFESKDYRALAEKIEKVIDMEGSEREGTGKKMKGIVEENHKLGNLINKIYKELSCKSK